MYIFEDGRGGRGETETDRNRERAHEIDRQTDRRHRQKAETHQRRSYENGKESSQHCELLALQ
jgi:hypothetical protein